MVLFERPEESDDALEWMTERAEILLQRLGLAYRVLLMSTREMGFTQARKYDLEVWAPGVGALARGQLLLELPRFPGPPHGHPLPPGAGRKAGARPYAQRLGTGAAAGRRGASRDVPAGRMARSRCPRCSGATWGALPSIEPGVDHAALDRLSRQSQVVIQMGPATICRSRRCVNRGTRPPPSNAIPTAPMSVTAPSGWYPKLSRPGDEPQPATIS